MKFINKKISLGILSTTAVVAMPIAVVACSSGQSSENPSKNHSDINHNKAHEFDYSEVSKSINDGTYNFSSQNWSMAPIDWSKISYVDATITKWIDGDTPHVNFSKQFLSFAPSDDVGIRISGIDTPELHVENKETGKIDQLTTGNEFKWADKGRIFGDSQMPKGTKIRIATNGDKTYNRVVGSIFYGPNFSKNYSVEIMKKGLCYPFLGNKTIGVTDEENIMHYIALPISDAYNTALDNKIGIFSPSAGEVSVIHGQTDVSTVTWKNHKLLSQNIYKIIGFWDRLMKVK